MKNFNDLSEREILALAISLEEEDERVYADFFEGLRQEYAGSAAVFDSMRQEESEHRRRLSGRSSRRRIISAGPRPLR
jgi:rubrerythrin